MQHIFEYYKDAAGEWRWRVKHSNGNILVVSSEGYKNKADMFDTLHHISDAFLLVKKHGTKLFIEQA